MTDFKPIVHSNLPPGFRPVRLNLTNNQLDQQNRTENIYDEPCATTNFETNQQHQVPPPLPSSQPPSISFNQQQQINNQLAQPFWSLPSQEQELLQRHLQQHLSRSPTPTFGQDLIHSDNIKKVITDKEPPANAEFLYETDAFKFYTIPASGERKLMTIKQQNTFNRKETQNAGPTHRHGSEWYKTMYKNMHITDKPKWMYEEPIKIKKNKRPKKENRSDEMPRNEFVYDNQPIVNQYQYYSENERRKKELQREVQRDNPYILEDPETKYTIKKKKTTKSKSPISRKTYAMIQKGEEDIPLSGLNRPAPKSKNKVGFFEQKQLEQAELISRSPSPIPVCLTYPASDRLPERPPTPLYISQPIYNQQTITTTTTTFNQYNNQSPSDKHIYRRPSPKQTKNMINKKTDFSSIDEWQRKLRDDFNQIYSTLEKNFELKRLRETGKLISPIPPSENKRDTGYRTAKDLYLNRTISPKPPSRKYYIDQINKPLLATDLFNEDTHKSTKYKATTTSSPKYDTISTTNNLAPTINTAHDLLDSNYKLNRYNSSQDLNYLNPNNKTNYDFNVFRKENETTKKSIYQHNSLDNLNTINTYHNSIVSNDCEPSHNYSYKIYAQPTTTRTYTESTYYDTANEVKPIVDLKTKTTNSFQLQTSLLDIEKQLNEQFGDLLRSTSSFSDRKSNYKSMDNYSPIPDINNNNLNNSYTSKVNTINVNPSPPIRHQINLELEKLSNIFNDSIKPQSNYQTNQQFNQSTTNQPSYQTDEQLNRILDEKFNNQFANERINRQIYDQTNSQLNEPEPSVSSIPQPIPLTYDQNNDQLNKQTNELINDQVNDQLKDQISDPINNNQINDQVSDQINDQTNKQTNEPIALEQTKKSDNNINEHQLNEDETQSTQVKAIPFDLKPNQDVNNISFQTNEEEVDSYDKLIKKIEQDAIEQDEIGVNY